MCAAFTPPGKVILRRIPESRTPHLVLPKHASHPATRIRWSGWQESDLLSLVPQTSAFPFGLTPIPSRSPGGHVCLKEDVLPVLPPRFEQGTPG